MGGSSRTVLSMTSYSVDGRSLMYQQDSLLFAPPIKDLIYSDPYTTEVLDGSWVDSAWGSDCLDQDQVEVVYDTVSMEDEMLSPLFSEKNEWHAGIDMVGNLVGPYGMPLDEDLQQLQHPIHDIIPFHEAHTKLPIEGFHGNVYDYRHDCRYQSNTPPSPLGLVCPTHLIQDCYECNQLHSPPGLSHFPTPLEVAAANLDMMMSLDVQNYYIDGFGNMAVVQGGEDGRGDSQR